MWSAAVAALLLAALLHRGPSLASESIDRAAADYSVSDTDIDEDTEEDSTFTQNEYYDYEGEEAEDGCVIDLTKDVATQEPLIMKNQCEDNSCAWLLSEGDQKLSIRKGGQVLLACPDKSNRFERFPLELNSLVAECSSEKNSLFKFEGREYPIQDFACQKTTRGEILDKNATCGPRNAKLLEIGFMVRAQWYPLIFVCHVKSRAETLYTEHVLQGESTNPRRQASRPSFEEGGLYQDISANGAYKNVNRTLQTLTGHSKFPSDISTNIDRGHLSPDGDFPITPYRYSTYFYVNTVPMWSVINRGNWVALEEKIRQLAKGSKLDFNIATGTFRVLEMKDRNGDQKEFFLSTASNKKQIPVPQFLWKVVYDTNKNEGIAFVVLNNPFKKAIDPSDELCPDICKESGWHDRKWKRMSKGYLYCCDINQLKKYISYLPKANIKSVLRGPA